MTCEDCKSHIVVYYYKYFANPEPINLDKSKYCVIYLSHDSINKICENYNQLIDVYHLQKFGSMVFDDESTRLCCFFYSYMVNCGFIVAHLHNDEKEDDVVLKIKTIKIGDIEL